MKKVNFGVSYVSGLTNNRRTVHFCTKKQALKEAQQLYREGAKFIDSFEFKESIGAVSFNWRKF